MKWNERKGDAGGCEGHDSSREDMPDSRPRDLTPEEIASIRSALRVAGDARPTLEPPDAETLKALIAGEDVQTRPEGATLPAASTTQEAKPAGRGFRKKNA